MTRSSSGSRGLIARSAKGPRTNVASLKGHSRIPALRVHRSDNLEPVDIAFRRGIPLTSVARTFVDVAGQVGKARLESRLHEASRKGILNLQELDAAIGRNRGKKGVRLLGEILNGWDPRWALTRNELERIFLELCRRYNLPVPVVNRIVAGREVDFFFPEYGLIVETDGGRDHNRPHGIERDKDRDSDLQLRGFLILRLTWNMLKHEPEKSIQKVIDHLELCRKQGRRANEGWGSASIDRR